MIPKFPHFKRLTLEDRDDFERLTHGWTHYTEYSFTTTFSWNVLDSLEVSNLNDNLVIKFLDHSSNKYFYSIIGLNDIEESLEEVFEHSKSTGSGDTMHFISHEIAEHVKGIEYLEIVEDPDNHDYVVSIKEFVELKGTQVENKRYKINLFERKYGNHAAFKKLDLENDSHIRDIRTVLEKWKPPKDSYAPMELVIEFSALERMLKYHKHLKEIEIYGLYIHDNLEAFAVINITSPTMAIGQFEKANKDFAGIFEYLSYCVMKELHSRGITHINIQQDLGHPGIRQSKTAYWPITYQKKYSIRHKKLAAHTNKPIEKSLTM